MFPVLAVLTSSATAVVAFALMFGVIFTAILFMIAYFLQHPPLIALAKEELASLFFTAFIIFFWVVASGFLNPLISGLLFAGLDLGAAAPGQDATFVTSHVDLAIASVDILIAKLKELYIDLYLYEAMIGFLSTMSFPIGNFVPAMIMLSFSLAPFTGLTLLSNAHTTVVDFIAFTIGMLWSKSFILMFARDAVPLILLPLGIVLRAFPTFRSTGSSLIALSFAFYFVFPFTVLLSNLLIFDYYKPADFTYTPSNPSVFRNQEDDNLKQENVEGRMEDFRKSREIGDLAKSFASPSVVYESSAAGQSRCSNRNIFSFLYCSTKNAVVGAWETVKGFFNTLWDVFKFMLGFTGDFFWSLFVNPIMPGSTVAGLYYFIIKEVVAASQFLALVVFTTFLEIIITITMYRNIAQIIGGELELIGITKVV